MLLGVLLVLLGVVMAIRGLSIARNAYLALFGDETGLPEVDGTEDTTNVKLSGTIEDVPEPVETAESREAAVYNLKAVAKNWRNLLGKRKDRKWLLAEGARLRRAVVDGGDPTLSLNLTPGATVTGGSWRTLAWTEVKSAVKAPVGCCSSRWASALPS